MVVRTTLFHDIGSEEAVFLFSLVAIVFLFKSQLCINYDVMVVMAWLLKHCVNNIDFIGSCCQPQHLLPAFKTQTKPRHRYILLGV